MTPPDHTPTVQPQWDSRMRTVFLRSLLGVGALTAVASLLLIVGALTADTAAGRTGQPAGVLGVIGLFLGGTLMAVGVLAQSLTARPGHR
ncbi:hypothetical protein ACF07T_01245 [Streptomyces sp. NPDC015184]|uniref:hypothetical protein n=1 Tax=Streptomyces sp. NPDC015184 TaxID=3364946 RepID=UPI0036FE7696